MPAKLGVATLALAVAMSAAILAGQHAAAADRNCDDFANQSAAQKFFEKNGGPQSDPHRLDGNGDGVACESLPCPCANPGGGGGSTPKKSKARVKRIIDGDTIEVKTKGRRRDVRLIGMDTPESGRCGFDKATNALARLLRRGEKVKLLKDPKAGGKDRFGRLLRYVEDPPVDAGRRQVRKGWAKVLVIGSGFQRERKYRKSQRTAKNQDRGVWGQCGRFPG